MFRSARVQFPVHFEICKRAVEAKKKRGVNGEPKGGNKEHDRQVELLHQGFGEGLAGGCPEFVSMTVVGTDLAFLPAWVSGPSCLTPSR